MRLESFATVLAASAAALTGCSTSGDGSPEDEALATVEGAYETFNNGDVDAWNEIRDRGSAYASDEEREAALAQLRDRLTALVEAGARYEDIECESRGDGNWPVADEGPVSGYDFICETPLVDDGGVVYLETFEWVVHDGEIVAVVSDR